MKMPEPKLVQAFFLCKQGIIAGKEKRAIVFRFNPGQFFKQRADIYCAKSCVFEEEGIPFILFNTRLLDEKVDQTAEKTTI